MFAVSSVMSLLAAACGSDDPMSVAAVDPDRAPSVEVDRFSAKAGMLQVRSASNGLPGPDEPVDFDRPPFITEGLGPEGQLVRYYNFDVRPTQPAPIYVLFREGATEPVAGQLNIVDVIPGDDGYNDFWQVTRVTVPSSYVANSVTSLDQLTTRGYAMAATESLVNCPVVPDGSTATERLVEEPSTLFRGWYRDQIVHYFTFSERPLAGPGVPIAPIYVTFNLNPDQDGGGPPSGFKMEPNAEQTHNVLSALPETPGYSPLWSVNPYDNADFDQVSTLSSAESARVLDEGVATVNCPVVAIEE
jgi:hypothetical protein